MSNILKLKKNTLIEYPSGGFIFGSIPDMPNFQLPGGDVYLRAGEHFGPGRGFGLKHIWAGHQKDLALFDCFEIDGVAAHIASLITPGAPIYCEFRDMRGMHRVAVLRNTMGTLVLEPRHDRSGFAYSVITWHPGRRASGTLVGNVARTALDR